MPNNHRLSKNKDFLTVYKRGKSWANRSFAFYIFKRNDNNPYRIGISVSKKVGNAVVRNRVKRLVKAVLIEKEEVLPIGYDFVIIARNSTKDIDYYQTKDAIEHLFKKSKIT